MIVRMKDDLEKFVAQHRAAFDDLPAPNAAMWDALDRRLAAKGGKVVALATHHPPRRIGRWHTKAVAAAALLLVAGGLLGSLATGIWLRTQTPHPPTALSDISAEYAEVEQFYALQINQYVSNLQAHAALDADLQTDLAELDAEFDALKQELARPDVADEEIVALMIENYRTKLAILQRVAERLQPTATNSSEM